MATVEWQSRIIELTAKAPFTGNPSDMFRWIHRFTPALTEGGHWDAMGFNGADSESDRGELTLDCGEYTVVQDHGDYNASGNNVSFYVDGALQYTFDDPGLTQEFSFSIPFGQTKIVRALQTQSRFEAAISVRQTQNYGTSGERPSISEAGDTLTVKLGINGSTPCNGALTATPKLFSAAGAEVAAGDSITLIINVSGSGGC